MKEEELIFICKECIEDEFLKQSILQQGEKRECFYCHNTNKAVSLVWLAEKIHHVFEKYFILTPTEPEGFEYYLQRDKESDYFWIRKGEDVNILIYDIVGVSDEIAEDVQKYLSSHHCGNPMDFEEDPYGYEACYEEKSPENYHYQESWEYFCNEIRFKARYFGSSTIETLDTLFGNLNNLKTYNGTSVITKAGPNTKYSTIFRARVCLTQKDLGQVLSYPIKELGAPPAEFAKEGRMNAGGISVFYGATDAETCIAETRPPVGSNVVIGNFNIVRDIKLLNLDSLSKVYAKGSYFDPEYESMLGHASFLNRLVGELIKPVMPGSEMFEYLPTQVIAEYLAHKIDPRLDGILFKSSQIEGEFENIILFQNSSRIAQRTIDPRTSIKIDYGWSSNDDFDNSITVYEELNSKKVDSAHEDIVDIKDELFESTEITLNLDLNEGIEVRTINGVSYESQRRLIDRYTIDKSGNQEEPFT